MNRYLQLTTPLKFQFILKCMLWFFLCSPAINAIAQTESTIEKVVITSGNEKIQVSTTVEGALQVNISPKDVQRLKARRQVSYSDFGARGDGKTDDIDAIAATHAFANQHGLVVKANEGATYYIGGKARTR